MSAAESRGRVLGIDVGYSLTRRTTGFCLLCWDNTRVDWRFELAGSDVASRTTALAQLIGGTLPLDAVAIDGPLRPDLAIIEAYRSAECILSRGSFQRRGKPGPTNGGSGPALHAAATELARLCLEKLEVGAAGRHPRVCDAAIVEAFPNLFLGVLCHELDYPHASQVRRRWTDALFPKVRESLSKLVESVLPARRIDGSLELRDHEEIAAFCCALTAACVSAGRFEAVGSVDDGFIVLPPVSSWGRDRAGTAAWANVEIDRTLSAAQRLFPSACRWVSADRL